MNEGDEKLLTQDEVNKIIQKEKAKAKEQAIREIKEEEEKRKAAEDEKQRAANKADPDNEPASPEPEPDNTKNVLFDEILALREEIESIKNNKKIEKYTSQGINEEQARTLSKLEGIIEDSELKFITDSYKNNNTASALKSNQTKTKDDFKALDDVLKEMY